MNKFSEFNNIFIQYIFVLVTKSYLRFNRPNPRSFNKDHRNLSSQLRL